MQPSSGAIISSRGSVLLGAWGWGYTSASRLPRSAQRPGMPLLLQICSNLCCRYVVISVPPVFGPGQKVVVEEQAAGQGVCFSAPGNMSSLAPPGGAHGAGAELLLLLPYWTRSRPWPSFAPPGGAELGLERLLLLPYWTRSMPSFVPPGGVRCARAATTLLDVVCAFLHAARRSVRSCCCHYPTG